VTAIGGALVSANGSELQALPVSDNPTTKEVSIGVLVYAAARSSLQGNVTFTEGNRTLGVVEAKFGCYDQHEGDQVCEARLPVPGFALGQHVITAYYSGQNDYGGYNTPATLSFTIYVSELPWLPALLKPLTD
jgi:outer membrane protein assembly factor BamB